MSTTERYEKVRADWLLASELSWTLADRRMANELKRRANRKDLIAAGAAESSHHEGKIKPIWSRFLSSGEDSKEKMFRGLFLFLFIIPAVLLFLGPSLLASQVAYKAVTQTALGKGQVPKRRAWFIAGAVLAVAGALLALLDQSLITVATVRFYPSITLDVHWLHIGLIYGWIQVALSLLLTGWEIRRHGWPGVVIKGTTKLPDMPAAPAVPKVPAVSTPAAEPETRGSTDEQTVVPAPKVPTLPAVPTVPKAPDVTDEPEFEDEAIFDEDAVVVETADRR